jgi:4-aminobutyrate--pyruvate transaminase
MTDAADASGGLRALDREHLWHPATDLAAHERDGPLLVTHGEGIYVHDDRGRRYIEGMAGLWCNALGYGEEELVEAAARQMRTLAYSQLFASRSHEPGIRLAGRIAEMLPPHRDGGPWHVLFGNSGSDANDSAVKLVRQYFNATGQPRRKKIVSRQRAYHGVTLAAASLTGLPNFHAPFDLPLDGILHASCPHHYRHGLPGEDEEGFAARLAEELDALIRGEGPETVAAFIAEPVMGAGGVIVPPRGYFEAIQPVLRRHGVLFVCDEVITGFGRLGEAFGCQSYAIEPDMVTMAKALSSGYQPISALAVSDRIYAAIRDHGSAGGPFAHGYTYSGHPVACAVALRTLELYAERDVFGHVGRVAPHFQSRLAALARHRPVGNTRGRGLIGAIELVADRDSREPFPAAIRAAPRLAALAQDEGVLVRALPGDTVALCPPLVIRESEIDELFDRLDRALMRFEA